MRICKSIYNNTIKYRRIMKVTKRINEWKPLTLEGTLLSNGIEGLIGIEELTDYSLERFSKKGKIITTEVKSGKRVKSAAKRKCLDESKEASIDNVESSVKKLKVKKAKTRKLDEETLKSTETAAKRKCLDESKETSIDNVESSVKKLKVKKTKTKLDEKTLKSTETINAQIDFDSENDLSCDTNNSKNLEEFNVEAWSSMGVPAVVIKALADQNFYSPTAIQAQTLPAAILGRRDILGAAETGSGKTLAFGIPIIKGILDLKKQQLENAVSNDSTNHVSQNREWNCSKIEDNNSDSENEDISESKNCVRIVNNIELNNCQNIPLKPFYALILTPTRELAIQIKNHLIQAAKYTDIKIAVVLGGMAAVKQERILNKGPEIVIATPGRLWELIQEGNAHLNQIDSIRYLAIDETDRMMEKGHFQELYDILEKMNANPTKLEKRQSFVFSATLTMVHDLPNYLEKKKKRYTRSKICKLTPAQKLQKIIHLLKIKSPKVVDITKKSGMAGTLTECRIACTIDHKDYYLYYFLKRYNERTLVFCNSIGCVKRLSTLFSILECKPLPLHANMQQRQRLKNLERFQADKNGLLIATDVAARGLDIPNIEHVIHYQVPRTSENYVHRSGRTARAEKDGITILMMEPSEKYNYSKLCKTLGRTDDLPTFPVVDRLLIAVKERVDVARDIDKLELKCRRQNTQKSWLRKAIEDMDMVLDDNDDHDESSTELEEAAALRRELKVKRNQLRTLLSKPVFPKGFSGKYFDYNVTINPVQDTEKAIEVMKKVLEKNPSKSKENNTLSQERKQLINVKTPTKFKKT